MAHPQIAVFARLADGNTPWKRKIEGQNTRLGRTMHAIPFDEIHDEFHVPQPFAQAILTFRGGASGNEAPIRTIQGPLTQLSNPDRMTSDPIHNELFVIQSGSIVVFPREANGNVAPIRRLGGPDTQLGAGVLAIDPVHDLLIVGGNRLRPETGGHLLIFNRTDQGNTKPKRVIKGPRTGLSGLRNPLGIYPPRGWIVASDPGAVKMSDEKSYVGVWHINDDGDVPPRWRIGGPHGLLRKAHGVALVPQHKEIIVSDKWLNAVLTFRVPEIF